MVSKDIAPMSIEDKYNYPNFNDDVFNFNLKKKDSLFDETIDFILTFFLELSTFIPGMSHNSACKSFFS